MIIIYNEGWESYFEIPTFSLGGRVAPWNHAVLGFFFKMDLGTCTAGDDFVHGKVT